MGLAPMLAAQGELSYARPLVSLNGERDRQRPALERGARVFGSNQGVRLLAPLLRVRLLQSSLARLSTSRGQPHVIPPASPHPRIPAYALSAVLDRRRCVARLCTRERAE